MVDEELIEAMAESAHKAWMHAVQIEGFTSRLNPWGEECMVPFADLSERAQEFDRIIMRSILQTFADRKLAVVEQREPESTKHFTRWKYAEEHMAALANLKHDFGFRIVYDEPLVDEIDGETYVHRVSIYVDDFGGA